MRDCALRGCLIACVVSVAEIAIADSNHPIPRPWESGKPPQAEAENRRQQPQYDQTGSEELPFFIKEAPPKILQKQCEEAPAKESSNSSPEWWTVYLTAVLAAIGVMQTIVFGLQAHRLKQTIEAMEKIGADQSKDMQGWINATMESVVVAEKTLSVTQRPWIRVDIDIGGPLVYDINGANFTFNFILENIGNSPARDVWPEFKIVLLNSGDIITPFDVREIQTELCRAHYFSEGKYHPTNNLYNRSERTPQYYATWGYYLPCDFPYDCWCGLLLF
jgi:hypothetical protein